MNEPMTKAKAEAYLEQRGFKFCVDAVQIWVPKRGSTFSLDESAAVDFLIQYFSDQGITLRFHHEKT